MNAMSTSRSTHRAKEPLPERFLILLRHGIAEERTEDKKDEDRSLTAEGHARMKEVARGLGRIFPKAQLIVSSPLLRAVQTALWVSKGYRSKVEVATNDALSPGAAAKKFLAFVKTVREQRIIFVGHEPTMTEHLRALTGIECALELKKGGCYGVRLNADGTAVLEWMLTPRILRKLAQAK